MADLIYVGLALSFFALSWGFVAALDAMRESKKS